MIYQGDRETDEHYLARLRAELKDPALSVPCCGYVFQKNDYPVFWNPYNEVVQCHNCGEVYVPMTELVKAQESLARSGVQLAGQVQRAERAEAELKLQDQANDILTADLTTANAHAGPDFQEDKT